MPRSRLQIFRGPDNSGVPFPSQQVTVRLREIYPMLAEALHEDRTWLLDFEDEEVHISADLYDCICACKHSRPSA